jgi:hypothetical protein
MCRRRTDFRSRPTCRPGDNRRRHQLGVRDPHVVLDLGHVLLSCCLFQAGHAYPHKMADFKKVIPLPPLTDSFVIWRFSSLKLMLQINASNDASPYGTWGYWGALKYVSETTVPNTTHRRASFLPIPAGGADVAPPLHLRRPQLRRPHPRRRRLPRPDPHRRCPRPDHPYLNTDPPTVAITSPLNGASIRRNGAISIAVSASDARQSGVDHGQG